MSSVVVCLTGGIASGKTTVSDELARLGAHVVDTDIIARELTAPKGAALPAIVQTFGPEMLAADESMDRQKMRDLVFKVPSERLRLEAILHPLIHAACEKQLQEPLNTGSYHLAVVPLLTPHSWWLKRSQAVVVVDCPEEVQLQRLMKRNGLSEQQARAIMAAQISRAERLSLATEVIENNGDRDSLLEATQRLHLRLSNLCI
jgi:dephospho-CoA kinase